MRYVIMAEECPWKQGCADIKTFGMCVVNIKDIVDQKSEQILRQKKMSIINLTHFLREIWVES